MNAFILKKILLSCIGFVLCTTLSFSQHDTTFKKLLWIKSSVSAPLSFYEGSRVTIGFEYKTKSSLAFNSEYHQFINLFPTYTNHKGFILKQEIKRYHNAHSDIRTRPYFSIHICYSNQSFDRKDKISISSIDTLIEYDKFYHTKRQFYGLSGQYGCVWRFAKILFLELHVDLGIRYNSVQSDLTELEATNRELGDWTVPWNTILKPGNHLILKWNMGLKIGLQLFKLNKR
jgi:hypothetical protein